MVSPILIDRAGRRAFYWNIDANVGANSPNRDDDVQLVQLGYAAMAMNPKTQNAELRAAAAQVKVGNRCTGRDDDPLVRVIRIHQKGRGGTQDGHVSVIKTTTGLYQDSGGGHLYMLIPIVNNIFDLTTADFPRIDKHPACPPALRDAVIKGCGL